MLTPVFFCATAFILPEGYCSVSFGDTLWERAAEAKKIGR